MRVVGTAADRATFFAEAGAHREALAVVSDAEHELRDAIAAVRAGADGSQAVDDDPEPRPSLRLRDLGEPAAVYDYVDEDGRLLYVAVRFDDPKTFRQARLVADRWVWNLDDTRRVLYRLPRVLDAVAEGETVYVAEGEKDVHAIEQAGGVATCNPMGAGKWQDSYSETIQHARRIVIVADRDEPGHGHASQIVESLARVGRLSDVHTLQAREGKDAADHLAAGWGLDDFEPLEEPPGVHEARVAHSWTPVDLLGIASEPPEPPTIGGIAYPDGRRHTWTGEPESLKSWAAKALCLGEMRAGRSVVYLDFENGRRETLARLRALGADDDLIRDHFIYLEPSEPLTTPDVLADVRRLLTDRRPSLGIIDAAAGALALHGCEPNSGADIERFYRTVVDELRRDGASVVVLDHVVKDREARGRYAIGSERKTGIPDVHLRFEVVEPLSRGRSGRVNLVVKKDRPGHLRRPRAAVFEIASNPDTGAVTFEFTTPSDDEQPTTFRPTALMEKASRYVGNCVDPPSRNQVEKAVKGSAGALRLAVEILIREGYLAAEPGPRGATLLRPIRPYRQADEGSTSSNHENDDLVSTSSTPKPLNHAEHATSSDLVPTSSPDEGRSTSSSSTAPYRGGTTDEDEVEDEHDRPEARGSQEDE